MTHRPIEDYAAIGDMHTLALVGKNGSIDWLCMPQFDSPSLFGALLDEARGGYFQITPRVDDGVQKQLYWADTNVLVTRFLTEGGAVELVDFMPVPNARVRTHRSRVIRRVTAMRGQVPLRMVCQPAFDYGRADHKTAIQERSARFSTDALGISLHTEVELKPYGAGVVADFELSEGQEVTFLLEPDGVEDERGLRHVQALFRETVQYWHRFIEQCCYQGRWVGEVRRSALLLKLLTFAPTGAILAAPTTSLPEAIGAGRNWDYRFTWMRDSAFTIHALLQIGFVAEAKEFIGFLLSVCQQRGDAGPLQLMYGINGRTNLTEEELPHLAGYRDSRPIRVGNAAYDQLQLDIYGEVLDALYLYDKHGAPIDYETWQVAVALAEWVVENWQRPDESIWEMRGGKQHFVYSKLMCWVALDRALRLAQRRSLPANTARWSAARDQIYREIMERGYSHKRHAFIQHYGGDELDASLLKMPLVRFVSPVDPRMTSTLDGIMRPRRKGGLLANHLVYRYNDHRDVDGLAGGEGTFNCCTFWLVEALAFAGQHEPRYVEEARLIFERMLGFASSTGLFAEETGPRGEALGNYPQGLTHLTLISAATRLDEALTGLASQPLSARRTQQW